MCGIAAVVSFRKKFAKNKFIITRCFEIVQAIINRGRDSYGIGISGNLNRPNSQTKIVGAADAEAGQRKGISQQHINEIVAKYPGERRIVIGHVRYPTTSEATESEAQPHHYGTGGQRFVLASNGDLPFYEQEKAGLIGLGYKFESNCDAEVIVKWIGHIWNQNGHNEEAAFMEVARKIDGAYSLVAITPSGRLFVMRDRIGYRPLYYVVDNQNGLVYVCSEPAPLRQYTSNIPIEVSNGTLLVIDPLARGKKRIKEHTIFDTVIPARKCGMEYVYFGRPDSEASGADRRWLSTIRILLGEELGREWLRLGHPVPNAVGYLPRSGEDSANGFAKILEVPMMSIIKKDTSYRIFMGSKTARQGHLINKLTVNPNFFTPGMGFDLEYVVIVDDSIVRGQQSARAIEMLRTAGCKKIGFAVTWPLHKFPCTFGLNTGDPNLLIGHKRTTEEVRQIIQADHLLCLDQAMIAKVLGHGNFCYSCTTGTYLSPVPVSTDKGEIDY